MRKSTSQIILMGTLAALCLTSCEPRQFEEITYGPATIPVKIDWSESGIPVSQPVGEDYVHRVSIRFFPKDGSEAFDRYLEGNVSEGSIEVPIGKYAVIAFNESVSDPYWSNSITFSDVNDYSNFSATIVPDDISLYPIYETIPGENIVVEPHKLASWSLDDLEITEDMAENSCRIPESSMITTALTHIKMRKLTYNVNVLAEVENLRSAQLIQGAIRGFSNKVYMASGVTAEAPSTHVFTFNGRKWTDDTQTNGTTEKNFSSFGLVPSTNGQYFLPMNVQFVTGEVYKPSTPLLYDVSSQANSYAKSDVKIRVKLALPYKEGGIDVDEWEDEEHIIN